METAKFGVQGMHCAACANTIYKLVQKVDGVKEVQISFGNESAEISFDPGLTSLDKINQRIDSFGYKLTPLIKFGTERLAKMAMVQSQLKARGRKVVFLLGLVIVSSVLMGVDLSVEYGWLRFGPVWEDVYFRISHFSFLIIATYALVAFGKPYFLGVWNLILGKSANMDSLIGLSVVAAYSYSTITFVFASFFTASVNQYSHFFDVVILTLGFVSLGKYLEDRAKVSTRNAVDELLALQVKDCLVLRGGNYVQVSLDQVTVGETVLVRPGAKVPLDGEVLEGHSYVDEAMISGEPLPVLKQFGDLVLAGTLNQSGSLSIVVKHKSTDSMLARIAQVVEQAQASKATIEKLVDAIAARFVPAILLIATVTFLVWLVFGLGWKSAEFAWVNAFTAAMSVLAVACPCALGLATPLAIIAGIGKGAKMGILYKSAQVMEKLRKINYIGIDKTGTLTYGRPVVKNYVNFSSLADAQLIAIFASLEAHSDHPLAKAVASFAIQWRKEQNLVDEYQQKVQNFIEKPGVGISGTIDGQAFEVISFKEMSNRNLLLTKAVSLDIATTPIFLVQDSQVLGLIQCFDKIKDNAALAIKQIKDWGIIPIMLTGDRIEHARTIAQEVGIEQFFAELSPLQKMEKLAEIQGQGHVVAMIGDGINDSPALAQADVGIALSRGSEIAVQTAGVVLLQGNLQKLVLAIALAKKTYRVVFTNLGWAFGFNVLAVPLAAGVFYPLNGWLLNPAFAAGIMSISSLVVVSNSLRLKYSAMSLVQ